MTTAENPLPRHPGAGRDPENLPSTGRTDTSLYRYNDCRKSPTPVIPAQAGTQVTCAARGRWIPAFAGMTTRINLLLRHPGKGRDLANPRNTRAVDTGLRRHDAPNKHPCRHPGAGRDPESVKSTRGVMDAGLRRHDDSRKSPTPVIPAQAGIQVTCEERGRWIPACAGMTIMEE